RRRAAEDGPRQDPALPPPRARARQPRRVSAPPERELARLPWRGREIHLEYEWVGAPRSAAPPVVVLPEGLGSISMWKDSPRELCAAYGLSGFVFSRYGYGNSTPKPRDERWPVDFMHQQAHEVLPGLFAAGGIAR